MVNRLGVRSQTNTNLLLGKYEETGVFSQNSLEEVTSSGLTPLPGSSDAPGWGLLLPRFVLVQLMNQM